VKFENARRVYIFICVVLCLILLLPTVAVTVPFPEGQRFSELWILGPTHMMEGYPFNVSIGANYHVFLGVGNHMGGLEYYSVRVKLRNQSEPMPDDSAGIPSGLPSVYEYRLFLQNNAIWETEFSFSFSGVSFEGNVGRISTIMIDGYPVNVNKITTQNEGDNGFRYELFFELWIYNSTISAFQFHDRSVGFWINMTEQL
jgi:hypothetical protein